MIEKYASFGNNFYGIFVESAIINLYYKIGELVNYQVLRLLRLIAACALLALVICNCQSITDFIKIK